MTTAAVLPDPGRGTASPSACDPDGGTADSTSGCDPLAEARAAVAQALGVGVWSRSEPELVADLRETLALRAQVDALLLTQIAELDSRGVAGRRGCSSTRAWLRSAHRIGPGEASMLVKTATALRDELPGVGAALAEGELSLAQAQVCVTAIADLPAETPLACRPQAEATMIEAAASFDPVLLARIGRRLAEIIDPDGVQARDEHPIQEKEADAHRSRDLTLTPNSGGAGGTLRAPVWWRDLHRF
ncbi:MAG: 13E12 repeat family protein [Actinomycetota bacterium]|nr:13E12 repeat family protein [Actinomycetota bacterium]